MPKIKGLRYYIAALLMLITMINYIDRTCLGVAGPVLRSELSINAQQFAFIIMCFQVSYLVMQPVFGRILDWLNVRTGFALAILWWSLANICHALARTPITFGICRALLGFGEAGNFPGVAKTASVWFPARERTIATGIANIGSGTGALIAMPLVAWIIVAHSWQLAFIVTGALGFVILGLWLFFYRPPQTHPMITSSELVYIQQGQEEILIAADATPNNVWKFVLTQKNFWAVAIARFLSEPAWQFFSYWIPLYLASERGMNLKDIALFAWLPFLAADAGSFVGGLLSPAYQKLGLSVLTARKASMTTAALIMPLAVLIASAPSAVWAIVWFCFAAFGHNCISATLLTLPADLFPGCTVATANGLSGTAAHLGGMLFTLSVGWIVMHTGYKPVFFIIAVLDLIGAAVLWTLMLRRVPVDSTIRENSGSLYAPKS